MEQENSPAPFFFQLLLTAIRFFNGAINKSINKQDCHPERSEGPAFKLVHRRNRTRVSWATIASAESFSHRNTNDFAESTIRNRQIEV
jgi:hypothetical protein